MVIVSGNAYGSEVTKTYSNGNKYVGKKNLYHKRTRPPLKGYKRKRVDQVESDWAKYNGSIKDEQYKADIKSGKLTITKKEILQVCFTKWELTYYETKLQFELDVLLNDN